jgi:hypothetical protein
MPKGEGSPRIPCLRADALEERLLMSHETGARTVHALSEPPPQVAPMPVVSKPEVDPGHPVSTNPGDVQEREADEVAAAALASSIGSKDLYTIPLVIGTRATSELDEITSNAGGALASSRNLRVFYADEPVAWGLGGSNSSNVVTMAHDWSGMSPEVPETSLEKVIDGEEDAIAGLITKTEFEETLGVIVTQGADLLAPYLPVDRAGLELAIDRLIDGIEVLGEEIAKEGDAVELIPLPIAWGIGLAAVEVVRRRLRPRIEGDDEPDRDPALGLRGSPG